ncbi:MAG: DUF5652 family protein [Candidatus Paceibacterota bacterium]|jgi:hypothetical protein|nr:DUF5652 family protein [Candidatus Paceibacterota bacterium]MDD4999321.1 DUF5652 family protein [Candidatus Paceibacterota bacterium]
MTEAFYQNSWLIWIVLIWSIFWKGMALWKAAQRRDKLWFIAILILNTLGILDIFYLYVYVRLIDQKKAAENKIPKE